MRNLYDLKEIPRVGSQLQLSVPNDYKGSDLKPGQSIVFSVTPEDVSDTQVRDSYIDGYRKEQSGIAETIAPVIPVDQRTGKRRGLSAENVHLLYNTRMGRMGTMGEISASFQSDTYEVADYGLMTFVEWDTINAADPVFRLIGGISSYHARLLSDALMRERSKRVFDTVTTLANWKTTNRTTLSGTTFWDTGGSRDILGNLRTYIDASLSQVTDVLMNQQVARRMLEDSAVNTFLNAQFGSANARPEDLRRAQQRGSADLVTFSLPTFSQRFVVVPDKYMAAPGGSLLPMLGDDVVGICNPGGGEADEETKRTCVTYRTRGRSGTGMQTDRWMPHARGVNGGEYQSQAYSEVVQMTTGHDATGAAVGCDSGFLIKDVLST